MVSGSPAGGQGASEQSRRLATAREALAEVQRRIRERAEERRGLERRLAVTPVPPPPLASVPATARLRELEYAVVDVETTGMSPRMGDRVTEVAVVCVRGDGTPLGEFSTLVNPERPIPASITSITKISDAMVAGAPRFGEVSGQVWQLLAGRVFVAHNAHFDWRFLAAEELRCRSRALRAELLCTVRLSRRLVPELPRRSLDALTHFFGIENCARHRALGDAAATSAVLLRLVERAQDRDLDCWEALDALLRKRRMPRRRSASPRSMQAPPDVDLPPAGEADGRTRTAADSPIPGEVT